MHNHIIYLEVMQYIDPSHCARLPRSEVAKQANQIINDVAQLRGMHLPRWEVDLLTRQLIHDLPCLERSRLADGTLA